MSRRAKQPHELIPSEHKGQARVCYRGKWYSLGPWDRAKKQPSAEALERLESLRALWRADPLAAAKSRPGDVLLARLWADYRQSPEGTGRSESVAERVERYLFGSPEAPGPYRFVRVTDFGAPELRSWQRQLCDVRNEDGKLRLSRDTVQKCVGLLMKCFEWGVVSRILPYEQFRELELVPPPATGQVKEAVQRKGVLWESVEPALPYLSTPLADCLRLMWFTGARPSELLRMKVGEVLRGGKLHAVSGVVLDLDQLGVWAAVREVHKEKDAGYDRVLFFGPKAQPVLAALLEGQPDSASVFRPAVGTAQAIAANKAKRKGYGTYKKRKGDDAKRKPGAIYHRTVLLTRILTACEKAEIPPFTPYQLRHQVLKLVQQNWGRDASRVFGGHKVGGATEGYAGADLTTAAKVAKSWG